MRCWRDEDHIGLTDVAKYVNPDSSDDRIRNWIRNHSVIEYLIIWDLERSQF